MGRGGGPCESLTYPSSASPLAEYALTMGRWRRLPSCADRSVNRRKSYEGSKPSATPQGPPVGQAPAGVRIRLPRHVGTQRADCQAQTNSERVHAWTLVANAIRVEPVLLRIHMASRRFRFGRICGLRILGVLGRTTTV